MKTLRTAKRLVLPVMALAGALFPVERAQAIVHLWEISQVYSNADGSVQYIELFTTSSFENFTAGREVRAYRDGERVGTFVFDRNLDGDTAGHLLLATGPIEGVEPDFVIPPNFVPIDFDENAAIDISEFSTTTPRVVTYEFIPLDGFRSLDGQGNIKDPATVTNFAGDSAELNPPDEPEVPEITRADFSEGEFHLTFSTVSGRTYTVEVSETLDAEDWEVLESIEGDGDPAEVTDTDLDAPKRFYRVRVE